MEEWPVIRSKGQIRGIFLTEVIARAGPSHNYHVELLYQRRTRRARSVFQRLALPTPVSISNGICSGGRRLRGQRPFWWRRSITVSMASLTRLSGLIPAFRR
jgi:hypothetical protein